MAAPWRARQKAPRASLVVEGSTDTEVFETYLREVLCPTLEEGQVVVDDLSSHKGERVRELIEGEGCELWSTCRPARRT